MALGSIAAFQQRGPQQWALIALAVASFVAAFWGPAWARAVQAWNRRQDDATARQAVHEFRALAHRFAELVEGTRNDTLHAILQDGLRQNLPALERLQVAEAHWLRTFTLELLSRTLDEPPRLNHLARTLGEFHSIVRAYADQCLTPVFERVAPPDRQLLLDACGSSLAAFRERYVTFRDDYEKYVKALAGNLRTRPHLLSDLPRPKPLGHA